MDITSRELWTIIHGMTFGALFLLAFAGGLAGLYSLRPQWVTTEGLAERTRRLNVGMVAMALIAWATVIVGTFVVYPWYRAAAPAGTTDLGMYPKFLLLASESTAQWHEFGMEWKEHVGWIAPIVASAVAFIVVTYGKQLANDPRMRRAIMWFFIVAFATAGIAGMFGAFITKAAPLH
jgi:hypothetical protein